MEVVRFAKKYPLWLILGIAVVLRVINLNQSLWLDEATQAILSSNSLADIILKRAADFHPPLSYIILHFWMNFGKSEVWMRLLPVLFGVATVCISYLLAKDLFSKKVALLSALFLAIAPYHIYYSQELRMYSMAAFFATLSMYYFQRLIFDRGENFTNQIGFIVASSLLLYTHYLGLFVIVSQVLFIIAKERTKVRNFISNFLIVILLYAPWLPFLFIQLQSGVNVDQYLPGWRDALSLSPVKAVPLTLFKFSFGRIDFDNNYIYGLIALPVLLAITFVLFKSLGRFKDKETLLIVFWFFVPIILALLISIKIPLIQPFRLLPVLPAFYLLLAIGVFNLKKYRKLMIGLLILMSLSGLSFYYSNPRYQREDWKSAVRFIEKTTVGNQVIFAWPKPFDPYIWYEGKNGIGAVNNFPAKEIDVYKNMGAINTNEVFLFEYLQDLSDPDRVVQKWLLENGYQLKDTLNFKGVGFLRYYVKGELNV